MSEYQYYEFAAIDQPLTRKEMAELRAVSTRATITPTSFTNHYEWGDLKADPRDWMRRYFDAFVYLANWGTCWLALRLPQTAFSKAQLDPFCNGSTLSIESSGTHWILEWQLEESENYERFGMDDGESWMSRLVALRDELLRGDLRPLYLGWLASASCEGDEIFEPEVPPGLAELSPAQEALVEFLEIDWDWLAVGCAGEAKSSDQLDAATPPINEWLKTWSVDAMRDVLAQIAEDKALQADRQVKSHYAAWLKAQRPSSTNAPRRSMGELRKLVGLATAARMEREAKAQVELAAASRRRRESELSRLMDEPELFWESADAEAQRGIASSYQRALQILVDLAEGYALFASREEFDRELRRFLAQHGHRTALMRRLINAGLWTK